MGTIETTHQHNSNLKLASLKAYLLTHTISSVYSPFSDRVGLPLHNIPSSGVFVNSNGAEFLQPDPLPSVNHMRGMQFQIVGLNIAFCLSIAVVQI